MIKSARIIALIFIAAFIFTTPSLSLAAGEEKAFVRPTREDIQKEVTDINAAIKTKGARWHAGETSMTRLSNSERKIRLGILDVPLPRDMRTPAPKLNIGAAGGAGTATTPSPLGTLDWREQRRQLCHTCTRPRAVRGLLGLRLDCSA